MSNDDINKNICIIYFIYVSPDTKKSKYKKIIKQQINILGNSHILKYISSVNVVLSGSLKIIPYIKKCFKHSVLYKQLKITQHNENNFEYWGIDMVYNLAKSDPTKDYIYLHTKGITSNTHKIRKALTRNIFRKIYYTLLKNNNDIMKCGLFPCPGGFIWFNFWWARGQYLITCEKPQQSSSRYYYESWLSTGQSNVNSLYSLYNNNFDTYEANQASELIKNLY